MSLASQPSSSVREAGILGGFQSVRIRLAEYRKGLRRREAWLVGLAVVVGCVAGGLVSALHASAEFLHHLLFLLPENGHLSTSSSVPLARLLIVPAAGGLTLGLFGLWLGKLKRKFLDPIEANALHGGEMSFRDSMVIVAQTLVSNGFGASVGLEAAYTQISSALASLAGMRLRLRRSDIRILVGCGAAGAIAAAFNAPLAGAFYCFELILGSYTAASLAPVIAAAIAAVAIVDVMDMSPEPLQTTFLNQFELVDVWLLMPLGVASGLFGIAVMVMVTRVEGMFAKVPLSVALRPFIGGAILGPLALLTPQILSSGHAAMMDFFVAPEVPMTAIAAVLILKLVAAAVSLGSGFRGGLFFASLFLGALLGAIYGEVLAQVSPGFAIQPHVVMLAGMASVAAAVVGCPLAMAFLTLELANSLPLALVVLPTTILASLLVRDTFGYSFATWRFHLRGVPVRSAHDVGLVRGLTVGRMMRKSVSTIGSDATLKEFRRTFPLGSSQRVVIVGPSGEYGGIAIVSDAFSASRMEDDDTLVSEIVRLPDMFLLPATAASEALATFHEAESEELAVVKSRSDRTVVGILTEAHLLRRYTEELEKLRADLVR